MAFLSIFTWWNQKLKKADAPWRKGKGSLLWWFTSSSGGGGNSLLQSGSDNASGTLSAEQGISISSWASLNRSFFSSLSFKHLAIKCHWTQRAAVIGDVIRVYSGYQRRTIIFCETKKEAQELSQSVSIKLVGPSPPFLLGRKHLSVNRV